MEKKRILIVTQEMDPYINLTEASKIANSLPKYMQENGMEIQSTDAEVRKHQREKTSFARSSSPFRNQCNYQ
jgi:hypothetical protein